MDPPPPRYQIESDSSDEEGHGVYPSSGAGAKPTAEYNITITAKQVSEPACVVVGIGQAGRYFMRRVRGERIMDIVVDGNPEGAAMWVEGAVFVLLVEVDAAVAFEVARRVTAALGAKQWSVHNPAQLTAGSCSRPTCRQCTFLHQANASLTRLEFASCLRQSRGHTAHPTM